MSYLMENNKKFRKIGRAGKKHVLKEYNINKIAKAVQLQIQKSIYKGNALANWGN